ncbi:hypothetical protein NQ152_07435 [Microbacterium sp. zg.B48]|uniref:hypothetical protein n=1 Tax=Microbacterium sp. zg.B48 TaxID=2969408 RepID=UPI00214B36B3|nr:hypothetical protein [Microbacterium sp. zg.B48]MCR2763341.1 hypothetical protein [Microbacterium sp. zg.B48]
MQSERDESFFEAQPEDAFVYWVCFWTGDDVETPAQHDPQRVSDADSVEEVLAWISRERGERGFELFVETVEYAESRDVGSTPHRKLVRLAGHFRPAGTQVTIPLIRAD